MDNTMTTSEVIETLTNELYKAQEKIDDLEKENEELLNRLRLAEAYRFCGDSTKIIRN